LSILNFERKAMVPSVETCFQLMDRYGMLENIRQHSVMVARIARLIARCLLEAGEALSLDKVTAGALLHDIAKTSCLRTKKNHAEEGRRICLRRGFEEIAPIVAEHVVLKKHLVDGRFTEKEVVYYADKRVNNHAIVSLEERLCYILERYGGDGEALRQRITANFNLCKTLEKAIFQKLPFAPEELSRWLEQHPSQLIKDFGGNDGLS
jgi:uncharacterized protein